MTFEEVTGTQVKKLEIGEVVEGKFIGMSTGAFGENPVINDGTEDVTLAGDTVILTKFSNIKPETKVRVTRLEDAKSQTGRQYHDYKVEVDKVDK